MLQRYGKIIYITSRALMHIVFCVWSVRGNSYFRLHEIEWCYSETMTIHNDPEHYRPFRVTLPI